MRRSKNGGFSLIELMVVVAIAAILAAIAYPSYTQYVQRGNLSAVHQAMLNIANLEDQYILQQHQYTDTVGAGGLNYTLPTDVSKNYGITITGSPTTFLITATPQGSMNGTSKQTLDNQGNKAPSSDWEQ